MKPRRIPAQNNRRGVEAASRVATILRVATRVFLKKGYANASLNEVVALAGGSKATLRKYFVNKGGLFSAVIADVSARFVADAHLRELRGDPTRVLQEFGEIVLRFYLAQDSLTVYRTVVGEGHANPEMAQSFYDQGHQCVRAALADRLRIWTVEGRLQVEDAVDAADMFLHMIRAGLYEQRLLGLRAEPTHAEVRSRVRSVVKVYLGGI